MSDPNTGQIDSVMQEDRLFPPSAEFSQKSVIGSMQDYQDLYDAAASDPIAFWKDLANKDLHWFEPFDEVLRQDEHNVEWFVGGKTNISYNCLDAHIDDAGAGDCDAGLHANRSHPLGDLRWLFSRSDR